MKQLYEGPFLGSLRPHMLRLLRTSVDSASGQHTRPLTPSEEYVQLCIVQTAEVAKACTQLHYALVYLSGYRVRRTPAGELISRADYIAYQIENFHLRLTTVPDRSLRLVNTVFRLGLPPRECRMSTIADNAHVRATTVRRSLRRLDKLVAPYREVRNTIAHREGYSDYELAVIGGFHILEGDDAGVSDPVVDCYRPLVKHGADRYILAKRQELEPVADGLVDAVAELLDELLPVFEGTHERMQMEAKSE